MRIFVTEFADSKKEIERTLTNNAEQVIRHLRKLVFMANSETVNHWETEIYSFINSVNKLSGKNKFPKADQIYRWTWGKWKDSVDIPHMKNTIKDLERQYNYHTDMTAEELCKSVCEIGEKYFKWLSEELSKMGEVSYSDVCDKLDELIGR